MRRHGVVSGRLVGLPLKTGGDEQTRTHSESAPERGQPPHRAVSKDDTLDVPADPCIDRDKVFDRNPPLIFDPRPRHILHPGQPRRHHKVSAKIKHPVGLSLVTVEIDPCQSSQEPSRESDRVPCRVLCLVPGNREDEADQPLEVLLLFGRTRHGVVEEAVLRDDMFDACDEEWGPVCGFGVVVGGETLVAPVWEECAGLNGRCVGRGEEKGGDEFLELGEIWLRVWKGKEVGGTVEDLVVDSVGGVGMGVVCVSGGDLQDSTRSGNTPAECGGGEEAEGPLWGHV